MITVTLRSLLARKVRLLMSATAVILGVSFVAGALTLTATLGKVFDNLFTSVNAKTAVQVRGTVAIDGTTGAAVQRRPLPASLIEPLKAIPGVTAVTADVNGYAQVVKKNGKAFTTGGAPTFGQNYDTNPATTPFTLRTGKAPVGPTQFALDAGTAKATGFRVGDQVTVLLAAGRQVFTLSGVFGLGSNDNLGGASMTAFEGTTATTLLGRPGEYADIRLATTTLSQTELRNRVAQVLPPTAEAATGKQMAKEVAGAIKDALGFFNTFLLVFAGVALFVGAFLIFNTFTILVAQRQRELALLRALGASQPQVTSSVLVEAGAVGGIASAIGLGLGLLVAIGLRALISAFGATIPSGPLVITTRTVGLSFAVGILVTAAAALLPARKASSVPPIAAMHAATLPELGLRRSTIVGLTLLAPGIALLAVGLNGQLALLGLGSVLTFLAVAALSPLLSRPAAMILGAPLARHTAGRLGRLNAMRNPRRTAATAAALMIGLALVSAVSVVGTSAKASIQSLVPAALGADLVVQGPAIGSGLPMSTARAVAALPEVGSADGFRYDHGKIGKQLTSMIALPAAAIGRSLRLKQVSGDVRALAPGTVLVAQQQAHDNGIKVGQRLRVQLPRGTSGVTVVGIYKDNQLAGPYLLDTSAAAAFETRLNTVLLLTARPGVTQAQLRSAVDRATAAEPTVEVLNPAQMTKSASSSINILMALLNVLLLLSVGIALLGIINTLALSVIDRTRELGLLRAVGLGRPKTRRMITVEAVIVAVFGALLGIAVGTSFGVALQGALRGQGITDLAIPYGRLGLFVLAAAAAGIVAALLPARRAAHLNVLQAISTA